MIKKLLALFAALFCSFAHAGYAQARPPSGWSPGTYAPSANDSSFGRVIHSPNGPTTIVGGQAVKMSASYRLAANAPRIAAAVIFSNPYVRTGLAIASWLSTANLVWDEASKSWKSTAPDPNALLSDGKNYYVVGYTNQTTATSPDGACTKFVQMVGNATYTITADNFSSWKCTVVKKLPDGSTDWVSVYTAVSVPSSCPAGWFVTSAGCVQTPPPKQVSPQQFEDALAPKPMPERVPFELPQPTPLPIEHQPFINPLPGPDPQHLPRFVPSGDPVPNPNYDPNAAPGPNNQPYTQPGTRVVPSPTPSQPWRVDLQPVNRPQADATPNPNPGSEPGTNPSDKPDEDQDLCDKNPDIAACENGDINDVSLPEIPKLYERKYPDGLVGIWNQKSDQIKQTSAFTLAAQLMPTGLVSGTCPSWPLALDFSWWASYGEYDVAPPCWIWDVSKTIIIISALMLARSLIFGG